MHRDLRKALESAEGESHFVVAVNIDIRGFSSFFSDSTQAAAYLSSAYTRILDHYFPAVSFFKPTGDGMLIVIDVTRETLEAIVRTTIGSALRLEAEFGSICSADPMINFPVPQRVGIGLARGSATRIRAGRKTLDYSGMPLNLASRLMDLARPRGVVFDDGLGVDLIEGKTLDQFRKETVYVKGIADTVPIAVRATSEVAIPQFNRTPIGATMFHDKGIETTVEAVTGANVAKFIHRLTHRPADPASLRLSVEVPDVTKNGRRKSKGGRTSDSFARIEYWENDGKPSVVVDYASLGALLNTLNLKPNWPITLTPHYLVSLDIAENSTSAPTGTSEVAASDDGGTDEAPSGEHPSSR